MDEKKRSEIDRKMVKLLLGKEIRIGSISNIKRNLGNASKELDVPVPELWEYAKLTIREMCDEQIGSLNKSRE